MDTNSEANIVTISLGSNYGDGETRIREAICWLSEILQNFHVSDIYETAPVGHVGRNYFNAVVSGKLDIPLEQFERECKVFELRHGRDERSHECKHVPIDLDVVTSGGKVLRPSDYKQGFYQTGLRQLYQKGFIPQYLDAR